VTVFIFSVKTGFPFTSFARLTSSVLPGPASFRIAGWNARQCRLSYRPPVTLPMAYWPLSDLFGNPAGFLSSLALSPEKRESDMKLFRN
jgi:hypothetical protein